MTSTKSKATTTTTRIMALEGQMHNIAVMLQQLVAAKTVAPAPARVDNWIPHYNNCSFCRPVIAIFDCDVTAFDFRAATAAEADHPVAVKPCRVGAAGNEFRGYAVY